MSTTTTYWPAPDPNATDYSGMSLQYRTVPFVGIQRHCDAVSKDSHGTPICYQRGEITQAMNLDHALLGLFLLGVVVVALLANAVGKRRKAEHGLLG